MPIQQENIVFVESQVMDDVPEGGGAATGNVIADGQMNNVFPDISDLDRAYGRFNLRKLAVGVRTASTDLFGGAKTLITDLPEDEAISYALFGTADPFDRRSEAANRVEAYLFAGSDAASYLLEDHIAGQRNVQLFARPGAPMPEPGETLVLLQNEGKQDEKIQYIRVTKVESEVRQFTFAQNGQYTDFDAQVITCDISDALRTDFKGSPPSRLFGRDANGTKVRTTIVADAARYYGASRLAEAASVGSYSARVSSIFSRVVPSSQAEIPLVDRRLAGDALPMVQSSYSYSDLSLPWNLTPSARLSLPTPCWPGSLTLNIGAISITDDGLGVLRYAGNIVGAVVYGTGEINMGAGAPSTSGTVNIRYIPAAPVPMPTHSMSRPVTAATRAYTWVLPLLPRPAPGSVEVAFMAQGRWYALRDDSQGAMAGADPGHGAGSINYETGTVNVTLGALPDAGSAVLVAWGSPVELLPLTPAPENPADPDAIPLPPGTTAIDLKVRQPRVEFVTEPGNMEKNSLHISWLSEGAVATAGDDGHGNIVGDATGQVSYSTGRMAFTPTKLPTPGGDYEITYSAAEAMEEQVEGSGLFSNNYNGTSYQMTLAQAPIAPGTVSISFIKEVTQMAGNDEGVAATWINTEAASVNDDGEGNLVMDGSPLPGSFVNYETGQLVFALNQMEYRPVPQYQWVTKFAIASGGVEGSNFGEVKERRMVGYVNEGVTVRIAPGAVSVRYKRESLPAVPYVDTVPVPPFVLKLNTLMSGTVVPGSLAFTFNGRTYLDRNGSLMYNFDPATGVGVIGGSIDYESATATITAWSPVTVIANPSAPAGEQKLEFYIEAGLLNPASIGQPSVAGRAAARPIKPGSFFVSAITTDGRQLTGMAASDGSISGAEMEGVVDVETGVYDISFGKWVDDPDIPAGEPMVQIWQSTLVDPGSLRYNAVAYSYLPLDAAVLGIDPVRLPADGRVPIYRVGDVAHILHTASTTGTPALDGGKYKLSLGRSRIAWVKVLDANGAIVTSGYELDRAAGVVEFDSLSGMALPLTVRHTISDLRQITDVQITGHISFARPLTHSYPAGETLVSSCLIHGDRRARVSAVWDQQTWNNTWTDSLQGSEAVGTLDTIAHPITVTNEGAETERWVLRFTTASNVELIGQTRGLVFSGPFTADIAPINPRTRDSNGTGGVPYLTIPVAANGGGWSAGNVVRINTVGAIAPFWIARAIQQSDIPMDDGADGCEIACIGNIDRP